MNILIAMDESDYAKKAVRYVAATVNPAVRITLFSVLPTISAQLERELHHPLFAEKVEQLKGVGEEKKKLVKAQIEACQTILKDAGIPDENITVKIVNKEVGIARDIITEAGRGGYDTVVVGRRGLSAAAAFVLGSVSNKIVQNIKNCTVWVVE
jgi:nucleotide-binding universal stress UspA family protein